MSVLHMISTTVTVGILAGTVAYITMALHADADRIRAALRHQPIRRQHGHRR